MNCPKCGEPMKARESSYVRKDGTRGTRWNCLPCDAKASQSWREANREKSRAGVNRALLKRRFGITPEELEELKRSVGYVCGICGRGPNAEAEAKGDRTLHIDHKHAAGFIRDKTPGAADQIRGFLCGPCNRRLGWFERYREQIVRYVDEH